MSNRILRRAHSFVATVGSLLTVLVAAREARAAITVNSNADPPGYNGPLCTLRMAVSAANGTANVCGTGTTIQLGGANATSITLTRSLGPLVVTRTMAIQGNFGDRHPDFNSVVISADPTNGGQIFSIPAGAVTLSLSFLRLTNGVDPSINGGAVAIQSSSSSLNLNKVQIDHCSASSGGAVYDKGLVKVSASSFHDNVALLGGAIFFESDSAISTVSNTGFSNNRASQPTLGGYGGAIYLNQRTAVSVLFSTFLQNSAIYGGGVANFGHLEVYGSTFESNVANSAGGAIYGGRGDMIVANDTITLNAASAGGGVFWDRNNAGYFELDRTTIVSNTASGAGGGVDINGSSGGTNEMGGQNIIANNNSSNGPDILGDLNGIGGIDLIKNTSGITNLPSGYIVGVDPLLGAYTSVNGRPKCYALQPGSPAIDRGTGPFFSFPYDGIDETGQSRPVVISNGSTPYDLGSFEYR